MLHLRVLSALVGIPVILLAAWYGNEFLLLLTAVAYGIAIREMMVILKGLGINSNRWIIQAGGLILLTSAYLYKDDGLAHTLIFVVMGNLFMMAFLYPRTTPLDTFGNITTTLYLGNFIFFYLLRDLPGGWSWILFLLAATWASDTFAYFVGRSFGKHKLAPLLSPKKTIEGALGGVAGAVLVGFIFTLIVPGMSTVVILLLGALIGVASLLGDLVESAFKRQAMVKDSGQIIPGHGGVLDRFDSLLVTAPLVYYVVKLFII